MVPVCHPPEIKVGSPREGGERLPRPCLPEDCAHVLLGPLQSFLSGLSMLNSASSSEAAQTLTLTFLFF